MNNKQLRQLQSSVRASRRERAALPSFEALLTQGGDSRIELNKDTGVNKYGCGPTPDPELISLGSSTASVISPIAFKAAEALWQRLVQHASAGEKHAMIYARELHRIRSELMQLCGVADLPGVALVFAASGTDIHLIAGRLLEGTTVKPALSIMVDVVETGSGVCAALNGQHFSQRTAMGEHVDAGLPVAEHATMEVASVALRNLDGTPRAITDIDAQVIDLVDAAAEQGRRVLLTLVDVTKTGLIAPSPACAIALQQRWPDAVEVLVDACQFRLAPDTLRAYMQQGFILALTGSKFVTGPSFSGALLFPASVSRRLRGHLLPRALTAYSNRADWPQHWANAGSLIHGANFGLLLRWQAALEELRAFRSIPETAVHNFLNRFASLILERLQRDASFEALPVPKLDRMPLLQKPLWDLQQTIFPFVLYHRNGVKTALPLTQDETLRVYRLLQQDLTSLKHECHDHTNDHKILAGRYHLGQPVACGERLGRPVSALRMCVSARMVVEALSDDGAQAANVIANALTALDKAALLV